LDPHPVWLVVPDPDQSLPKWFPKKGENVKHPCFEELSRGMQASFGARRFSEVFSCKFFQL
jgi:hypothetical protein